MLTDHADLVGVAVLGVYLVVAVDVVAMRAVPPAHYRCISAEFDPLDWTRSDQSYLAQMDALHRDLKEFRMQKA